jgi:Holliday junction resolvase
MHDRVIDEAPKLSSKKRGGRKSRRKGAVEERALLKFLRDRGFAAAKCSRAGYTGADLSVRLLALDRRVEVKVRARDFGTL